MQGQGSGRQGDAVLRCGISWCYAIDAGARGALVADALAYGSCTERLASLVSVGFCLTFCGGSIVLVRCIHALLQCVFCVRCFVFHVSAACPNRNAERPKLFRHVCCQWLLRPQIRSGWHAFGRILPDTAIVGLSLSLRFQVPTCLSEEMRMECFGRCQVQSRRIDCEVYICTFATRRGIYRPFPKLLASCTPVRVFRSCRT